VAERVQGRMTEPRPGVASRVQVTVKGGLVAHTDAGTRPGVEEGVWGERRSCGGAPARKKRLQRRSVLELRKSEKRRGNGPLRKGAKGGKIQGGWGIHGGEGGPVRKKVQHRQAIGADIYYVVKRGGGGRVEE